MLPPPMRKTLWDDEARAELLRRVSTLTPESAPQWGRMNASEMLAHVVSGMRMGLGEIEVKRRRSIFGRWPLKYLFVYWLPLPKGAPAPRELVTRGSQHDWEANLAALHASMDVIARRDRETVPWPAHHFFGPLSPKAWAALGWRHLDHHLRQFGA